MCLLEIFRWIFSGGEEGHPLRNAEPPRPAFYYSRNDIEASPRHPPPSLYSLPSSKPPSSSLPSTKPPLSSVPPLKHAQSPLLSSSKPSSPSFPSSNPPLSSLPSSQPQPSLSSLPSLNHFTMNASSTPLPSSKFSSSNASLTLPPPSAFYYSRNDIEASPRHPPPSLYSLPSSKPPSSSLPSTKPPFYYSLQFSQRPKSPSVVSPTPALGFASKAPQSEKHQPLLHQRYEISKHLEQQIKISSPLPLPNSVTDQYSVQKSPREFQFPASATFSSLNTAQLCKTVESPKPIKICQSLRSICPIHLQFVQKSPQKLSALDNDSHVNKHDLSETVGSLESFLKISQDQDREKVSKTLPLISSDHDQSANKSSELPEPITKSQMKKPAVSPFLQTKLVWSIKKSHQKTQSFGITEPVEITPGRSQTSSSTPSGEMLKPLQVSEPRKKSNEDLVVNSSSSTKSVLVASDESLQIRPGLVHNTQKHIKNSEEKAGAHSLPSKKIWVKKSPQEIQSDKRKKSILGILPDKEPTAGSPMGLSVSKKHDMELSESHLDNEIDEELLQLRRTVPWKYKLPVYPAPEHLKYLIEKDRVPEVLKKPLSPATYTDYFASLLYAEDFYIEKWTDFILLDVTIELHEVAEKKRGNNDMSHDSHLDKKVFVKFEIDSVPEKRPYLLSRDFVFLRHSGKKSKTFEGSLNRVMKSIHVLAEFGDDFYSQHSPNDRYDVSFSFNRVCLKRCHQAVASAMDPSFRHVLFPEEICCYSFPSASLYSSFENFEDQDSVVHKITTMKGGHPYLIDGPFSIQEDIVTKAVLQICRELPSCRILICAAKNRTCDAFASSLKSEIPESELFRANAAFRELLDVDEDVIPLCLYDGECFTTPSLLELRQFRVVTSTYVSSFRLHSCGITAGHFTHIFLVDASAATEPESMIALANLAGEKTTIVVAGCRWEHPPRVRSDIARRYGLKRSYFHRLLDSCPDTSNDSLFELLY